MKTIFQQIIDHEIPAYRVWENDRYLAFLDIFPIHAGQVLLIPKTPIDYLFAMESDSYSELMSTARRVAIALQSALKATRIGMIVEGLEVPHVHIKLIPIDATRGLNVTPRRSSEEELKSLQSTLSAAMRDL